MATAAKKSFGTTLSFGGSPVAEITNIAEVGPESEAIDVTSFDSPSGWREFIPGLKSGGTVSMDLNLVSSNTGLKSSVGGDKSTFSVTFTDGTSISFDAFVLSFKATAGSPSDSLKATVVFQATGIVS